MYFQQYMLHKVYAKIEYQNTVLTNLIYIWSIQIPKHLLVFSVQLYL